jgi:DNA (cytosine-5)-methyltransferase 1
VPNLGDFTTIEAQDAEIDLLVGGTPCQAFSLGGLRGGLDDERGNLALEYCRLAERMRPRWLVWENVPGVLSSGNGRDFGSFLGALGELGYGFGYRVLDAQHFGLAQRRRRVFVVAHLGGWQRPAAVLFERESLSWHPAPSRKARESATSYTASSFGGYSRGVGTLRAARRGEETLIAKTLTTKAQRNNSETSNFSIEVDGVRRLTPTECERLQGMPDGHTLVTYRGKPASDGPRYKAIGNSMAVPVMRWIGERIAMVDSL